MLITARRETILAQYNQSGRIYTQIYNRLRQEGTVESPGSFDRFNGGLCSSKRTRA